MKKLNSPIVAGMPTSEQLTCPEAHPVLESDQPAGSPDAENTNGETPFAPVNCWMVTEEPFWVTLIVPWGENVGLWQFRLVEPCTAPTVAVTVTVPRATH